MCCPNTKWWVSTAATSSGDSAPSTARRNNSRSDFSVASLHPAAVHFIRLHSQSSCYGGPGAQVGLPLIGRSKIFVPSLPPAAGHFIRLHSQAPVTAGSARKSASPFKRITGLFIDPRFTVIIQSPAKEQTNL